MIAAVVAAVVLGLALAGVASAVIIQQNNPDAGVQERITQLEDNRITEPDVVEYGQR